MSDPLDAFILSEHARLVGLLALQVGRLDVAEELAQDALARLSQHWPRVRDMAHRRAWLNRVAINLANSWLRRRYAEARANRRHGPEQQAVEHDHADVLATRKAVSRLPQKERTAIVLRYYEELSVAEAAAFMGCPEGTVKSLTHRAIKRMRDQAGLFDDARSKA